MRYFSFNEFDGEKGWVTTVSEEEIRRDHYPAWHYNMSRLFGEDVVNKEYSFQDCLEDWIVVHWAWEVDC